MAGDTEEPRSAVAFAAYLGIRLAAHQKNRRCGRNRLRVVDHRRSAVESNNGREGGLDTRNTTLAFERLHQRRLFADLVRARARLRHNVEVHTLMAKDILAEIALRVRVGYGLFHDLQEIAILSAQIDEAHLRADRQAGDHRAFDHGMRIVKKYDVVLAGSGLRLIAVYKDVLRLLRNLGDKAPLHARRESCAAATTQAARLHLRDHPFGAVRNGILHGLVAVQFDVLIDLCRALSKPAREDLDFIGMRNKDWHYFTSFPRPAA